MTTDEPIIKAIQTTWVPRVEYRGYIFKGRDLPAAPRKKTSARADLSGQKFGRLTVLEDLGPTSRGGYRYWGCRCDCGCLVGVRSRELLRSHTRSCGCLHLESIRARGGCNKLPVGASAFNQLFYSYQKSARERGYEFALTRDQFKVITETDCHYCGAAPQMKFRAVLGTNGSYYGNGVDRVDNSIGYVSENVVPCCKQCNIAKGVLSLFEFRAWVKALSAHFEFGESGAR